MYNETTGLVNETVRVQKTKQNGLYMSKNINNVSASFEKRLKIYPFFAASGFTVGIIGLGIVALFDPSPNDGLWPYYLYLLIFGIIFVVTGNYLFWRCPSCHRRIAGPLTDIDTISNISDCPHCGVELLHSKNV